MAHRIALTVVEVVVALGVLTLALVLAVPFAHGSVGSEARTLVRYLLVERALAVGANSTTASGTPRCVVGGAPPPPLPIRARLIGVPTRGLLFTPDGLPRTCDGGGVGNTTLLLEHRGRQAAVIVSSLGRVRWELR